MIVPTTLVKYRKRPGSCETTGNIRSGLEKDREHLAEKDRGRLVPRGTYLGLTFKYIKFKV